nr:nucleotide sugar dehydrogenase [Sulfurovaceae bacterium]
MKYKIAIIGLGYVGLPLAYAFSSQYKVVGFDIAEWRIDELNRGIDRTLELSESQMRDGLNNSMKFTSNLEDIKSCNIYIVTVPTPIDSSNRPDLTPLIKSSQSVSKVLQKDDIVIYESTVYPGVTEEICVPELESISKLKFNEDFYCGYSPERINPGDKEHTVTKILKVTSGSTPYIADIVDNLYKSIITAGTYKASSIKVAEASKVIENTQRDVNIALINELALIFDTMNIDTNEVIDAASTKWNFIKLKAGLVGGHCIGIDPYYLTYRAQELGYKPNLILGARQINNGMSKYIAEKSIKQMIINDKKIKDAKVLILGLTFKEDCPDIRNSKVFDIIDELVDYGCIIDAFDPWIANKNILEYRLEKLNFNFITNPFHNIKKYDAIITAVSHKEFLDIERYNYEGISTGEAVLIDIKGIIDNP